MGEVPVAPASSSASACTSPRPRAAPDTITTLSMRLNSGRRFVVPRYVGVVPSCNAALSASGGSGGPREGGVESNRGRAEKVLLIAG